ARWRPKGSSPNSTTDISPSSGPNPQNGPPSGSRTAEEGSATLPQGLKDVPGGVQAVAVITTVSLVSGDSSLRSLRLKVEPEAPIWQSMTVLGLRIWSARSGVPDRHFVGSRSAQSGILSRCRPTCSLLESQPQTLTP